MKGLDELYSVLFNSKHLTKGGKKIFNQIANNAYHDLHKVYSILGIGIRPAAAAANSLQSYPTLCDPIDVSPPG